MIYQSDILIDKFINEIIFRNKKDGFFVEIGALDGVIFSNSYIFEKYLNWSGVCIEPDSRWKDSIIQNRKCNISFNVISDTSNLDVEFCIHKNGGESFIKCVTHNPSNIFIEMLRGLRGHGLEASHVVLDFI